MLFEKLGPKVRKYLDALAGANPHSYVEIIRHLKERYSQGGTQTEMLSQFKLRNRKEKEPIGEYITDIQYLHQRAWPNVGSRERFMAVKDRVLEGIDRWLAQDVTRLWVLVEEPHQSVEKLRTIIQRLELRGPESGSSHPGGRRPMVPLTNRRSESPVPGPSTGAAMPVRRPYAPPAAKAAAGAEGPYVPASYSGCFICGNKEHLARNCSYKGEVKFIRPVVPDGSKGHYVCSNCEEGDHIERECPWPELTSLALDQEQPPENY